MLEILQQITPDEDKLIRCYWRRIGLLAFAAILLLMGIVIGATKALSAPLYRATEGASVILLTDEPCRLKQVSNLKQRATWQERGKTYEGCWGAHPAGVVLAYFDDGSVVIIPNQAFERVTGA